MLAWDSSNGHAAMYGWISGSHDVPVQELRNALASLERGMSGLEEHRVTLERTFRSTTDSLQQKMTERVKSDIEGLQEVMHRSSESLMKVCVLSGVTCPSLLWM